MEEITAIFLEERHRWDSTIIGSARLVEQPSSFSEFGISFSDELGISIKGQAEIEELHRNTTYRFYGRWAEYTNRRTGKPEQQFHFQTFCLCQPHGRDGIIAYLRRAGAGNGIGTARATRLWELYGSDAVRMLREQPGECAAKVKGLSAENAGYASQWLVDMQALEDCTIELTDLLAGRGFPQDTIRQAIGTWGNEASRKIRRNPYVLMAFPRCYFGLCDQLYLSLGLPPERLLRKSLAAWYAVASDSEGHTWYPAEFAIQGIRKRIASNKPQEERERDEVRAIKLACRLGQRDPDRHGALSLVRSDPQSGAIVQGGGTPWVAEGRQAANESALARMVVRAGQEPHVWPSAWEIDGISDHQRTELERALQGPIAILGGSPGTGKTYTAARLIKSLQAKFGDGMVAAGAFTGKASSRLGETLQRYGVSLATRTWHSWLGIGGANQLDASNPLPHKVLISDETSMNDLSLMHNVFQARASGTHVLLIGDINQLPPVGGGAPLRDLIRAGLPYGELREIKRNSGGIVEACAAIRDSLPWGPGDNLEIIETRTPEESLAAMYRVIREEANNGRDPIWDIQPVVAVNKNGPLCRKVTCADLQRELSTQPGEDKQLFRVGDKVVNTKNGWFRVLPEYQQIEGLNQRGETYVANGELAEVLEVAPNRLVLRGFFPDRRFIVPRGKATEGEETASGCTFDLGYSLSVHKSQGSEWPVVIVLIDDSMAARMVCDRAWLYTAISRARDRCVLIGKKATADRFCRVQKMDKRKTFLAEQILRLGAERTLVEM